MAHRREISTLISVDGALRRAMAKGGLLCGLLFTWAVVQADDWGRITGDADELKMMVLPGAPVTPEEIDQAADAIAAEGLWRRYEAAGRKCIAFKPETWFKYQNYVPLKKRADDSASKIPAPPTAGTPDQADFMASCGAMETPQDGPRVSPQNPDVSQQSPQNAAFDRELPQNPTSPSLSLSPTPTPSVKRKLRLLTVAEPESRESVEADLRDRANAARARLRDFGVVSKTINQLCNVEPSALRDRVDAIERQIEYLPYRIVEGRKANPARLLVASIRDNYDEPTAYQIAMTEAAAREEAQTAAAQARAKRSAKESTSNSSRQALESAWAAWTPAEREILEAEVSRRMKSKHYIAEIFKKNPNSVAIAGTLWTERAAVMAAYAPNAQMVAQTA